MKPLRYGLIAGALAFLLAAALTPSAPGFAGEEDGAVLVVLDPPDGFEAVAQSMGFALAARDSLSEIDVAVMTLNVPAGHSKSEARNILLKRFPDLTIDSGELDLIGSGGLR